MSGTAPCTQWVLRKGLLKDEVIKRQDSKGYVSTLERWPWGEAVDRETGDLSFSPGSASRSTM